MDITKEFTCVEWFFGYGGNHFGLKRVVPNLRLIAACEIEAYAIANMVSKMEKGWLDPAPIWSDCKTFPAEPFKDRVDLFIASYPCQAESTAGKRGGEDDPRYLWPFVRAFIETARPLWVWCENVEGHLSSGFPNVYADLSDMGYRVEAGIFSALEVGASQQRKRIFFLAKLADSDGNGLSGFLRETRSWEDWAEFRTDPYGESVGDGGDGASCEKEDVDNANGCGFFGHEGCLAAEPDSNGKDNGLSGERGQAVANAKGVHNGQGLSEKERRQVQQPGVGSIEGDVANNDELDGDNGRHGAGEVSQLEQAEVCKCGQDVANAHCSCTSRQQHISGEAETTEGEILRASGDDVSGSEQSLADSGSSECGAGRERAGRTERADTGGGCEEPIVADSVSPGPQGGEQRDPLHGDGNGQEAYGPATQFREICVAPPGEEQYFWEALRVVDGKRGSLAESESEHDDGGEQPRTRGAGHSVENEGGYGERCIESGLGRTADADSGGFDRLRSDGADITSLRADRLRLCGNGVDPVTAAKAFVYLMRKHDESERINQSR